MHELSRYAAQLGCLVTVLGSGLLACSSKHATKTAVLDASTDAARHDASLDAATALHDGGRADGGLATEGQACTVSGDCGSGLSCVRASYNGAATALCARSCSASADCGTETCYSYTGLPADAHCVNTVSQPFALCGLASTSICSRPLRCLYSRTSTVGLCIELCQLPQAHAGNDAGTDDGGASTARTDAGASDTCKSPLMCVDGLLASTTQGVCGTRVAHGGSCGVAQGRFCKIGDHCGHDTPGVIDSPQHCYQDCSSTGQCSTGICTVSGTSAYCL